jgi:DNA-binding IclR family transcriptional regulator
MCSESGHRPVETVDTAFDILAALKRADGAGITDTATELDLAKSTVYRHVKTLERRGLLVREEDTYRLSAWFLDYGVYVRNRHPLFDVVRPKVDELADETDEKVWCVIEERGIGVHLYGAQGRRSVKTYARIGKRTPLHQFAAGKAILANLPDERVDAALAEHGLEAKTPSTITDRDELEGELETIHERGYALNRGESVRGVRAVGAPVRDESGVAIGAISVAGPANRLRGETITDDLPALLLGAANEVEVNLAHSRTR